MEASWFNKCTRNAYSYKHAALFPAPVPWPRPHTRRGSDDQSPKSWHPGAQMLRHLCADWLSWTELRRVTTNLQRWPLTFNLINLIPSDISNWGDDLYLSAWGQAHSEEWSRRWGAPLASTSPTHTHQSGGPRDNTHTHHSQCGALPLQHIIHGAAVRREEMSEVVD